MTSNTLRLLSFGAGAIGTYIGGSLAINGHAVVFLERPDVVDLLHQTGLRLEINSVTHVIQQPLLASSIEAALQQGPYDAALFALKSFDTQGLLPQLSQHAADLPPFVCSQNGVENEPALAQALGESKVIPASVTSSVGRKGAGDIVLERLRGIGVYAGHAHSQKIVQAFNDCGLQARLYPKAADMKWSKMLTNLLANASSAILDMTPGEIFAHRGLYQMEIAQLQEALQVMRIAGIGVVNLPGTPVRLLAFGATSLPAVLSRPFLQRAISGGRGAKMPSFHIDLYSGKKRSEVEFLNGAIVRYARQYALTAPANRVLNETLSAMAAGDIPLDQFRRKPDALLAAYASAKK